MFARIQAFLAGFEYKVIHRSGTLQRNADALSRMQGLESTGDEDNLETDGHMKDNMIKKNPHYCPRIRNHLIFLIDHEQVSLLTWSKTTM